MYLVRTATVPWAPAQCPSMRAHGKAAPTTGSRDNRRADRKRHPRNAVANGSSNRRVDAGREGRWRARQRPSRRARAWSRSGTLLDEAARSGDFVTASAAAAASFSVIFAITASRARLKYSRLVATNSRDLRKLAT